MKYNDLKIPVAMCLIVGLLLTVNVVYGNTSGSVYNPISLWKNEGGVLRPLGDLPIGSDADPIDSIYVDIFEVGTATVEGFMVGNLDINGYNIQNVTQLGIGTDTPAAPFGIMSSTSAGYFGIGATTEGDTFIVDASGNVGIGTTSPNYGLEVMGSTTAGFFGISSSTEGDVFIINATGSVGIGVPSPTALLTIDHDGWIAALDSAGTGVVNMLKINAEDNIEVGGTFDIDGAIRMAEDGGQVTFTDMSVSATPTAGTAESYSMMIDSWSMLTIYAEATGTSAIHNERIGFGTSTPIIDFQFFDVDGTTTVSIGAIGSPGCIPFRDSDDGGWSYLQMLDGNISTSTVDCDPQQ